jgi:hypothetical protein
VSAVAQSRPAATVQSVVVVPGEGGPVLQITSTRALTPSLKIVEGPLRLVIDLPGSKLDAGRRKIPFRNEQIKRIRMDQFQTDPPIARIVVDLAGPVRYSWDAIGRRLRIRLRADEAATAKPPSVPALTSGVQPAAVPYSESSTGTLVEAGSRIASGASVTAGEQTAVLRLTRGGEVRVCPGTTVSVTTSPAGQDLLLGMSTGAMETHYRLEESSDSVLTPDFRIVFPGPGEFDFAVSADAHGNTCVSSLPGSTSSVVVAELLGNGTYEIKPEQQVMFHQGSLNTVETPLTPCGCPARQEPIMRASANPGSVVPEEQAGSKLQIANPGDANGPSAGVPGENNVDAGPETGLRPQTHAGGTKVEVEPLVFSGKDRPRRANAPPAPVLEAAALPLTASQASTLPAVVVLPPQADPKSANKGFFRRVKGFFASMFR